MLFADRSDAGRGLAQELRDLAAPDLLILGLPRGGVVVAYEIARDLGAQLDLIVTKKMGAPGNPEYAIGAVAETGHVVLNTEAIDFYHIPRDYVEAEMQRKGQEARQMALAYRAGMPMVSLENRAVVLVDDGIATGFTVLAAIEAVKSGNPRHVTVAVPVGPVEAKIMLEQVVDDVRFVATPQPFMAVGRFYSDFEQVTDDEVMRYLALARYPVAEPGTRTDDKPAAE